MNPDILVKPSSALMSRLSKVGWFKGLTKMSEFFVGAHRPKAQAYPEKKTLHASERETERVQRLRVEYWHEIGGVNLADIQRYLDKLDSL